jgi:transposase
MLAGWPPTPLRVIPVTSRLFAWFQNFRRLDVRYERLAENFLGMVHLACCVILLRGL